MTRREEAKQKRLTKRAQVVLKKLDGIPCPPQGWIILLSENSDDINVVPDIVFLQHCLEVVGLDLDQEVVRRVREINFPKIPGLIHIDGRVGVFEREYQILSKGGDA